MSEKMNEQNSINIRREYQFQHMADRVKVLMRIVESMAEMVEDILEDPDHAMPEVSKNFYRSKLERYPFLRRVPIDPDAPTSTAMYVIEMRLPLSPHEEDVKDKELAYLRELIDKTYRDPYPYSMWPRGASR